MSNPTKKRKVTSSQGESNGVDSDYDILAGVGAEYYKQLNFDDEFEAAFPQMVKDFVDYARDQYRLPEFALQRLHKMIPYTCIGGKMNRGKLVRWTVEDICKVKKQAFTDKLKHQADVLGWCVEILQAYFLVADDIMDGSITRRGKPCWYKLPEIQMDAVNDGIILESFMYFLLKQEFAGNAEQYLQILEEFREVTFQTQMGQMLDLCSQPQGQKNSKILNSFNLDLYKNIVHYKTAFYTFYLPFASAMIICGLNSKEQLKVAYDISVELGEKFQIQDDYLDCFQDPKILGKVGTDIQDHKCSWLVVQALKLMTPEQKARLQAAYGKEDEASVKAVKELYAELDLPAVYEAQEAASYERVTNMMEASKDLVPPVVFERILKKIHKRQK